MISLLLICLILVSIAPLNKNTIFQLALARISSIIIIFSSFLIMNTYYIDRIYSGVTIFYGYISVNSINQIFQIFLLIIGALILATVCSNRYFISTTGSGASTINKKAFNSQLIFPNVHPYLNNYGLIILFNLIGACALITANDMLTLYIAIETQSFSLYLLSTLKNDSIRSATAGLKYFLIGSLASIIILLGIALLYYASGLTNFENLALYFNITDFYSAGAFGGGIDGNSPFNQAMHFWNFADYNPYYSTLILSIGLIVTGLLIKVAAAPFHQWSIDVYSLVPTAVTTWLVVLPKLSIFVLLLQILELILGTGNTNISSNIATDIYSYLEDGGLYTMFMSYPDFIVYLEDSTILNLFNKIIGAYGSASFFYPHFYQIELTNLYNAPIANEFTFNQFTDNISSLLTNYDSSYHNSLLYAINITPIGPTLIQNLLIIIAILSLIIGAVGGIYQMNIKRLLAYSSVNNIGFILIALAINNKVSLEAFIFYLIQYVFTSLNVFLIIIALGYLIYSFPLQNLNTNKVLRSDIDYINQLRGFFNINPILALSLIVSLYSFAGIPPFAGFFAKQQVLLASLSIGYIFVSVLAILTSVISAWYYLNLVKNSILNETEVLKTSINNNQSLSLNLGSFFNKNNNFNTGAAAEPSFLFHFRFSSVLSYTISLLTLGILLFILKGNTIFDSISILTLYFFNI